MKRLSGRWQIALFITSIAVLPAFTQISVAGSANGADHCQTLQDCIDKYQQLIPQWQTSIEDFSERLKEELPKIEEDFKAFGKEGEKLLRQWLDELDQQLPGKKPGQPKPETTWI